MGEPLEDLEVRLRRVLRQAAGGLGGAPVAWREPAVAERRRPRASALGRVVAAVSVTAALLVAVLFVVLLRHPATARLAGSGSGTSGSPPVPATYARECALIGDPCPTMTADLIPAALRRPFDPPLLQPGQRCPRTAATTFTNGRAPDTAQLGNRVSGSGNLAVGSWRR